MGGEPAFRGALLGAAGARFAGAAGAGAGAAGGGGAGAGVANGEGVEAAGAVGERLGDGEGVGARLGDREGLGEGVGDGEEVGVGVGEGEGVGVGSFRGRLPSSPLCSFASVSSPVSSSLSRDSAGGSGRLASSSAFEEVMRKASVAIAAAMTAAHFTNRPEGSTNMSASNGGHGWPAARACVCRSREGDRPRALSGRRLPTLGGEEHRGPRSLRSPPDDCATDLA